MSTDVGASVNTSESEHDTVTKYITMAVQKQSNWLQAN